MLLFFVVFFFVTSAVLVADRLISTSVDASPDLVCVTAGLSASSVVLLVSLGLVLAIVVLVRQ